MTCAGIWAKTAGMPETVIEHEHVLQATAAKALRFIYGNRLQFTDNQVTPAAAAFAFVTLAKVDLGARAAYSLFKLYSGSLSITKWSDITDALYQAAKAFLEQPGHSLKSEIALAFIALPHTRNLQQHLIDPDTFPCPDYR